MEKSIDIRFLEEEPIIVGTLHDWVASTHQEPVMERIYHMLEEADGPTALILDVTDVEVDFSSLVIGLAELTKDKSGALMHPNLLGIYFVSQDEIFQLGADSLAQTQYGKHDAMVFKDLETALTLVRARVEMAQKKASGN